MNRTELDQLWNDDRNWSCYQELYHCPQDPRMYVKKRTSAGWTVNFGHKWSVPVFIFMLITLFIPLGLLFWRNDWPGIVLAVGLVVLVVLVWILISDRNEKRGH